MQMCMLARSISQGLYCHAIVTYFSLKSLFKLSPSYSHLFVNFSTLSPFINLTSIRNKIKGLRKILTIPFQILSIIQYASHIIHVCCVIHFNICQSRHPIAICLSCNSVHQPIPSSLVIIVFSFISCRLQLTVDIGSRFVILRSFCSCIVCI
jgi:hypothetical protein